VSDNVIDVCRLRENTAPDAVETLVIEQTNERHRRRSMLLSAIVRETITFAESARTVVDLLADYIEECRSGRVPVVALDSPENLAVKLQLHDLLHEGALAERLAPFLRAYLAATTRLHHPGYMAHQVSVPAPIAALGDLVHGVTNNPMAMYEMGPAAAAIELFVIDWMLQQAAWQPGGAGVLTHGGSLANLVALLAARAAIAPDAWDAGTPHDLVVLAPATSHYSIARAVSIAGVGRRRLRFIPVDRSDRQVPAALRAGLRQAREEGLRVMAVVANAAVTSTGAFDPLDEIADICRSEAVWLHVDGAHGASALLSKTHRYRLKGLEHAQSLTWDAHKMLRVPTLCTAVLLRDGRAFDRTFAEEASYLFYGHDGGGPDLIHRTIECTKSGLGLKLLFAIAAEGEAAMAEYWDSRCAAAQRFTTILRRTAGFEAPLEPESNIVCFRWRGDDAEQIRIREALLREGFFHISSTEAGGRRYLRLAVMNPATDDETLRGLLDAIARIASDRSGSHRGARRD
jgi:L-2,4-diaminobutyrate decarboxylase